MTQLAYVPQRSYQTHNGFSHTHLSWAENEGSSRD